MNILFSFFVIGNIAVREDSLFFRFIEPCRHFDGIDISVFILPAFHFISNAQ